MKITKIQNGPGYTLKIGEVYIYFDIVHILEEETDNSIILSYDGRSSAMLYEDDSEIFKKLWEKILNELQLIYEHDRKRFNNLKKELSTRASNCLEWDDMESWSVFKDATKSEFLRIPDFGPKTFEHIKELLIKHNIKCAINP